MLTQMGLSALALEEGRIHQAKNYAQEVVRLLREALDDSETPGLLRLELLYALNHLAKLETFAGQPALAESLWREAFKLAQEINRPSLALRVLESLQSLSVQIGGFKTYEPAWVEFVKAQLQSVELSDELRMRLQRYLVMIQTRHAMGSIRPSMPENDDPILASLLTLTGRANASIQAQSYAEEVFSQQENALLSKLFESSSSLESAGHPGDAKLHHRPDFESNTSPSPLAS